MKGEEREKEEEIYLSNSQTLDVLEAERLVGEGREIHTEGAEAVVEPRCWARPRNSRVRVRLCLARERSGSGSGSAQG